MLREIKNHENSNSINLKTLENENTYKISVDSVINCDC